MRITAGKWKGREIVAPRGYATRPVLSRVRQAIFNALDARGLVEGARVLDLFSGSGGFALEAISRGARSAVLVDLDAAAVRAVRENLARLGVEEEVLVYKNEALDAARKLGARGERFEVVAIAPPYWKGLQARALEAVDQEGLVAAGGVAFVQRDGKERVEAPALTRLALVETKTYGNTVIEYFATP